MNRKRWLIAAAAVGVPLIVAAIYLAVGNPAALTQQKHRPRSQQQQAFRILFHCIEEPLAPAGAGA